MRKMVWGFFASFLFFFGVGTGYIEMGERPDYREDFGRIIQKAGMRLQKVAAGRPLKLKPLNDSLAKTALAARLMATQADREQVWAVLESARRDYPENSFAILLQAVLKNAGAQDAEAHELFLAFLLHSRTFTDFEKTFLEWNEFYKLRRVVYDILQSRGVSLATYAGKIETRVPYEQLLQYFMNPGAYDRALNIFFVCGVLAGVLILGAAWYWDIDFSRPYGFSLAMIYLNIWIGYAIWLVDIAFGLPWGWNRFFVIPAYLGLTTLMILAWVIMFFIREWRMPLAEGYRRCPHCRSVILILAVECSRCRKPV